MSKESSNIAICILGFVAIALLIAIVVLMSVDTADIRRIEYRTHDNRMAIENTQDYPLQVQQALVVAED